MHIEYEHLDRDPTPFGELQLVRYRAESGETGYEIRIDGNFLMASHGALGEIVMARVARDHFPDDAEDLRVLVGGLGAGHTLRATLDLPGVREATVAEISPKVVAWNRRYFAETNGRAIEDQRVSVYVGDVSQALQEGEGHYDMILLDVDNGPGWLASERNAELYRTAGLERARRALAKGGVLAIWCPLPNVDLEAALTRVFDVVRKVDSDVELPEDGPKDVTYLAWMIHESSSVSGVLQRFS